VKLLKLLPVFLLVTLLPAPASACSCALSLGFCQALPDTSNPNQAIFVGKVTESYPQSRSEMNRMIEEFARKYRSTQQTARTQSGTASARRSAGTPSVNLEWRKQMIEYILGDKLTPTEREQLRAADESQLDRLAFDQTRWVRLEVLENFLGADAPQFTLYTALEGATCGFDFAKGGTYLVEAYKHPGSDTWRVSLCSRTRLLSEATENEKVLRAWKAGQRLPGRISGQILDRRSPPAGTAFQVRLLGGKQILETTSDLRGQFVFENLDAGIYQAQVVQPMVFSRPADLTRAWCAQVIIPLGP
jgi:hypothetical protein